MDRVHDLLTPFRIKHGSRFIKNNAVGLHGKNAGNSYTLLLPAGKHGRRLFTIRCHPHLFQCKIHTFSYFFRRHAQIFRTESHIFLHHGSDKLVVWILENHAHLLADIPYTAGVGSAHSFHNKLSFRRYEERIQMAGQRGLTATVRPDDGGKFPFLICAVTSLSASKVLPSSVSKVWETWQISKRTSPELLSILSSLYI